MRVFSSSTGATDYLLRVRDENDRSGLIRTDANGRFESDGAFRTGTLTIWFIDHRESGVRFAHVDDDSPSREKRIKMELKKRGMRLSRDTVAFTQASLGAHARRSPTTTARSTIARS